MFNMCIGTKTTESQATKLIFDACRANEERNDWQNGDGFSVTFATRADGNHEATLRNVEGEVIALASVDKFDC